MEEIYYTGRLRKSFCSFFNLFVTESEDIEHGVYAFGSSGIDARHTIDEGDDVLSVSDDGIELGSPSFDEIGASI